METSKAAIESGDEDDDDDEDEEDEEDDEDEEEIVNTTRSSRESKIHDKASVRSSGMLIESKEQSNLQVTRDDAVNYQEMTKDSGKKSSTASITSVKLNISKKLRFNLHSKSSHSDKNNFLTPNSAKSKQHQTSIESSTSETAVSSIPVSSITQVKSTGGTLSTVDSNVPPNQMIARRGKREKASAKRERKATKTLAIVLGK